MTNALRILAFLLVVLAVGCSVSPAVEKNIETEIVVHDGYARLIEATLAGELEGGHAIFNVDQKLLSQTPTAVYKLLENTIKAVYASRRSWHAIKFNALDGPDPATLDLGDPEIPPQVTTPGVLGGN